MEASWVVGVPSRDTAKNEIGLELPRRAAVARALAAPAEPIRRDVGKAPARRLAQVVSALLHDAVPAGTADLARVVLLERIVPQDVPGIAARVVDAQCRSVKETRQDPHVLDGTAVEHPAGMDLAAPAVRCSVVGMDDRIHLPTSDQPSVETHPRGPIGRGSGGMECLVERGEHGALRIDSPSATRSCGPAAWEKLLCLQPRR